VGSYVDASNVNHGFVRSTQGTITTIDAPGAGTGAYEGTYAFGINGAGDIAGPSIDGSSAFHGYVWKP
jgi:hypothetical protein